MTQIPDLWWSPSKGLIKREDGLFWLLSVGPLLDDGEADRVPEDAVRLGPALGKAKTHTCAGCGGTNTTYAAFSGGREYYCKTCDDNFPYEAGTAPRRVQMLADGKVNELRAEMREHLRDPDALLDEIRVLVQRWNDEPGAIADELIADKAMRRIRTALRRHDKQARS